MSLETLQYAGTQQTDLIQQRGKGRLTELYCWLWRYIRSEIPAFTIVLLLSILVVLAGLSQPYLTKSLIDNGILAHNRGEVMKVGAWMIGLALFVLAIGFIVRRIHVAASAHLLHRLRESLFTHVMTLSPDVVNRSRQGDLLARLEGDLGEVQRFAVDGALSAINSILTLIGTVIVLGLLSPTLAFYLAILMVINSVVLLWVRPKIEALSAQARDAGVDVTSFLVEKLSAVRCIQTHVAEARELERLQSLHSTVRSRVLSLQLFGYLGGAFPNLVLSLAVIGIFVGGSLEMIGGGALTLGTLVAFATYVQRASAPVHGLMGLYLQWQRVKVCLKRIDSLRSMRPAVSAAARRSNTSIPKGDLAVHNVTYSYPGTKWEAVSRLNFVIPSGAKAWLRGDSGSGKSTFIDLLHRHFELDHGSIAIGGVDIRDIDREILRRYVVVVSQDTVLFAGSLLDNITYGCPDATREEVGRAVKAAGIIEFVDRLPNGLDSEVGSCGAVLSGGERQRVALARALLMAPSILVIDEGTSSLDEGLEQKTIQAIDTLLPRATKVFVSHRQLDESTFDIIIDFPGAHTC